MGRTVLTPEEASRIAKIRWKMEHPGPVGRKPIKTKCERCNVMCDSARAAQIHCPRN